MALDWGIGQYEETAKILEPVARIIVDRVDVGAGDRVLDLGCGTGNAALLLAQTGASVTGIDPAARLLVEARRRANEPGISAGSLELLQGDAASIPLDDASVDLVVSVFAVIFAPEPTAAITEISRVLAPDGRVVLTAWVPGFGIGKAYAAVGAAMSQAMGEPPPAPPFAWHDEAALSALAAPHGLAVTMDEQSLVFAADSPEAQIDLDSATHPMWIDNLARLERARMSSDVIREPALAALREVNEDPAAFKTTSRYVIATLSEPTPG